MTEDGVFLPEEHPVTTKVMETLHCVQDFTMFPTITGKTLQC